MTPSPPGKPHPPPSQAIQWAWELSTRVYGLPPERVWVSVYEKDDEAFELWRDVVGVPEERIRRMGEADNFWASGPTGEVAGGARGQTKGRLACERERQLLGVCVTSAPAEGWASPTHEQQTPPPCGAPPSWRALAKNSAHTFPHPFPRPVRPLQ